LEMDSVSLAIERRVPFLRANKIETVVAMDANRVPRTIRLLQRAEGYLELHLPDRAIGELDSIADAGPFEPAVALLRGEALKSQARYDEALIALKQAATTIPAPLNKRAWRSLSECYRQTGRDELADVADLVLKTEQAKEEAQQMVVTFSVVPADLVEKALKMLLGGRRFGKAADESTEDQSAEE
jgi:tetratricopeptide (TPR) repeat protein